MPAYRSNRLVRAIGTVALASAITTAGCQACLYKIREDIGEGVAEWVEDNYGHTYGTPQEVPEHYQK